MNIGSVGGDRRPTGASDFHVRRHPRHSVEIKPNEADLPAVTPPWVQFPGMNDERKSTRAKTRIILAASAFLTAPIAIALFVPYGYARDVAWLALGLGFISWIPRDWRDK
jgi:hypothetical protein